MRRHYTIGLLAAATAAALSGCAYQDPLALPDLGPGAARSSQQYPGYNPYYGPGSIYGYGGYGSGNGYRQGYDPYYYDPYAYGGRYSPQYYSPGVVYVPYPVPCADANRNGRCDKRTPQNPDKNGDGRHHGNQGGGREGNQDGVPPRYQRDGQRQPGDGSGLQRDVTPSPRRAPPPSQVEREPKAAQRDRSARGDAPAQ